MQRLRDLLLTGISLFILSLPIWHYFLLRPWPLEHADGQVNWSRDWDWQRLDQLLERSSLMEPVGLSAGESASQRDERPRELVVLSGSVFELADFSGWRRWAAKAPACPGPLPQRVFQIRFPDRLVLIDSGLDPGTSSTTDDAGAFQETVKRALVRADAVFFRSSDAYSMETAAHTPDIYHFRGALRFTASQLRGRRIRDRLFPPAVLETVRQVKARPVKMYAPGLLLLQPDGLRPDILWFLVRTQDARSVLIVDPFWAVLQCPDAAAPPGRIWYWQQAHRLAGTRKWAGWIQSRPRQFELLW
ncbi:MAG: hypothetical protein KDK39_03145 [Leptospiraceae bacterium]|nr:hypothetical protein [Leptospiraceae bacterium]